MPDRDYTATKLSSSALRFERMKVRVLARRHGMTYDQFVYRAIEEDRSPDDLYDSLEHAQMKESDNG